jgi:type IV secretory pathway VirB4 component
MRKDPQSESGRTLLDLFAALPTGDAQRNRMRSIVEELRLGYGYIFGGDPTDARTNRLTVYGLSNLDTAPKYIATPAKELILYNTIADLDGQPSWVIWDEFWSAIADEVSSSWFFQAIRTMRGLNCGFIGLTQSNVEIAKSPDCDLLLSNMPGKLFFPDASITTSYLADSYRRLGLNDHEITSIASAQLGQFFYKSTAGSRLASAWLGPTGQAICAATGYQDVERARAILRQCTDGDFLHAWLRAHGLSMPAAGQAPDGRRAGTLTGQHLGNGAAGTHRHPEPQLAPGADGIAVRLAGPGGDTHAEPR